MLGIMEYTSYYPEPSVNKHALPLLNMISSNLLYLQLWSLVEGFNFGRDVEDQGNQLAGFYVILETN